MSQPIFVDPGEASGSQLQASGLTVEVAEVEQGVDLDPTTPRYFSRDGADTSEDLASKTLGRDPEGLALL